MKRNTRAISLFFGVFLLSLPFLLSCSGDDRPEGQYVLETLGQSEGCGRDFTQWLVANAGAIKTTNTIIDVERRGSNSIEIVFPGPSLDLAILLRESPFDPEFYTGLLVETFEVDDCLLTERLRVNADTLGEGLFLQIFDQWELTLLGPNCMWAETFCENEFSLQANSL